MLAPWIAGLKRLARSLRQPGGSSSGQIFARIRLPLHDPSFPLVLLFSHKAGCTALAKWFFWQIGRLDEAQGDGWVHHYRRGFNRQDGYAAEAVRLIRTGERPVIKLVRDPYDRAISSYLHLLGMMRRKGRHLWVPSFIAEARAREGKPAEEQPRLSFRQFLLQMEANGTDVLQANLHIAQQFIPAERNKISRIIKLERLFEEIRALESEFRLKEVPLEVLGSRHHRKGRTELEWTGAGSAADLELSLQDVTQNRIPPYEAFYDPEIRALVRRVYAADFEAYGYG